MIDDTCLTPFCKYVQLPFIQHMYIIKHVGLILKVLYQLPVCVALLVYHTYLLIVLLVEQEIYDPLFILMQNVYIFLNMCVHHN